MPKSTLLSFFLCFLYSTSVLNAHTFSLEPPQELEVLAHSYYPQAVQWVHDYLVSEDGTLLVSRADLQSINNLLYFSYARSCSTLLVQEEALLVVPTLMDIWQSIAQRRRNPSRTIPEPATIEPDWVHSFLTHAAQHEQVGSLYATITNDLVHGTILETTQATRAVETIRSQARLVISTVLLDSSSYFQQLYQLLESQRKKKHDQLPTKRSLSSFLMHTIPYYAQNSFVRLDKLTQTALETTAHTYEVVHRVSSSCWHAIEKARGAFYLAHYQALSVYLHTSDEYDYYRTIPWAPDASLLPLVATSTYTS